MMFDLFGDPIPEGFGKRGRPPHTPTPQTRLKVLLLLAVGRRDVEIAYAIGVSEPTLRKNYKRELAARLEAKYRLEATRLMKLYEQVEDGNVSAIKEMAKVQERAGYGAGQNMPQIDVRKNRQEKGTALGKKEQQKLAAKSVGGKYLPPAPPKLVVSNE